MLVGREPERALLLGLLARAREGVAGCVVVRGEPGIGKSALLDELLRAAGRARLLRTQGLEVESPLAYAALHRLLRPLASLRAGLPAPQARALAVAFGEEDGGAVEPFLVGVATLNLLTAAAEQETVLCLVDDAHWLDAATAGALLFCARRLGADRVAMVFAARDGAWGSFDPQGVPELALTGLDVALARDLVATRLDGAATPGVVERLVAESRGNPLALLELPGELSPAQLSGGAPLPEQLHLTAHVEQVFLERSRRLNPGVQSLLLVAAADDTGELAVLRRAADELGLPGDALEGAVDSGLLVSDGASVAVRHPLVRSAIYQAAPAGQRRAAHRALADALAEHGDQDRQAWHRASATEGTDAGVVDALESVGDRAQRRGAYVSALAAYERAASFSADAETRARLTVAAARSAWACGRATHAQTLLTSARETARDPLVVSDIARLRGHLEVNLGSAATAHRIFVALLTLPWVVERA